MPQIISAEEGALKAGADAVQTAKAGVDVQKQNVSTEADNLRATWFGPAADAYLGLVRRWEVEAKRINDILIELESALTGTESDRVAKEEDNIQTISGLGAMMGS